METSQAFGDLVADSLRMTKRLCELQATGLENASVDKVICLAGLHHVREKRAFFAEMFRVLKPGGRFCIADAADGSSTARFLDEFVHAHNSMGHQGAYLSAATSDMLVISGFSLLADKPKRYRWNFTSVDEMSTFCGLLFGMDRASHEQIYGGIRHYLGYSADGDRVRMNWELTFVTCAK